MVLLVSCCWGFDCCRLAALLCRIWSAALLTADLEGVSTLGAAGDGAGDGIVELLTELPIELPVVELGVELWGGVAVDLTSG